MSKVTCEDLLLTLLETVANSTFLSGSSIGWVLAAFFYGYLLTQLPGGWLAQRIGGKWVFGLGVVITSGLTMFTQLAADTSVWLLVALRVLEGLFEVNRLLYLLVWPLKVHCTTLIG